MKKRMTHSVTSVEAAHDKYAREMSAYLSERGWVQSSNYPDSCWRWAKRFGTKIVATSIDDAFNVQSADDLSKLWARKSTGNE